MRREIIPVTVMALMLATAPALAQIAEDPNAPVPTTEGENETASEEGTEGEGNFSRSIPQGQTANLTDEELEGFQAQLDAAQTPQERNAIRQELQRLNQERHLETVQGEKAKPKGFFEQMASDFKSITSGQAARDAKAGNGTNGGKNKAGGNSGKSKDRGGKDRGGRGGGGGGRNK